VRWEGGASENRRWAQAMRWCREDDAASTTYSAPARMYWQAAPASAETWPVPEAKPAGSGAGEPPGSGANLADSGVGKLAGSGAKLASFTPQAKAPPTQPWPVPEASSSYAHTTLHTIQPDGSVQPPLQQRFLPPPQRCPVPEAKPAGSGAGEPAGSGAKLADSGAPPDQAEEPAGSGASVDYFQWMFMPGQKGCPTWIILHGVSREPFCDLCKKVATNEHLETDKHRRYVDWFDKQKADSIGGGGGTLAVQQQPQLALADSGASPYQAGEPAGSGAPAAEAVAGNGPVTEETEEARRAWRESVALQQAYDVGAEPADSGASQSGEPAGSGAPAADLPIAQKYLGDPPQAMAKAAEIAYGVGEAAKPRPGAVEGEVIGYIPVKKSDYYGYYMEERLDLAGLDIRVKKYRGCQGSGSASRHLVCFRKLFKGLKCMFSMETKLGFGILLVAYCEHM
jgi:hypothetical protein